MSVIFTYRHRNLFSDEQTAGACTLVAQDCVRKRKEEDTEGSRGGLSLQSMMEEKGMFLWRLGF